MKNEFKREDLYTLSEIKKFGFTAKVLNALLKNGVSITPCVEYVNRYKTKCLLFLKSDIDKIMAEDIFKTTKQENFNIKISTARNNTVELKRNELFEKINNLDIKIERISIKKLKTITIAAREKYNSGLDDFFCNIVESNEETMKRWMVNHIRHQLTSYDEWVDKLYNKIGKAQGYIILKNKVLSKISEIYPELSDECKRQCIK